jgi:hydrogenase maturation protease
LSHKTIALIGTGNIMFHDEGLGIYLTKYIQENYHIPKNLTVLDGGGLGFTLMTYYQEYDKIITVGTTSKEGKAGDIFSTTGEEMMSEGVIKKTATEVEITMMLEICSFHEDMGEVELLSMIPKDIIEVKNDVTPTVLESMPKLLDLTLDALKKDGVILVKKEGGMGFEEVIYFFANPRNIDPREI